MALDFVIIDNVIYRRDTINSVKIGRTWLRNISSNYCYYVSIDIKGRFFPKRIYYSTYHEARSLMDGCETCLVRS